MRAWLVLGRSVLECGRCDIQMPKVIALRGISCGIVRDEVRSRLLDYRTRVSLAGDRSFMRANEEVSHRLYGRTDMQFWCPFHSHARSTVL